VDAQRARRRHGAARDGCGGSGRGEGGKLRCCQQIAFTR
jgi:hypothetical protein